MKKLRCCLLLLVLAVCFMGCEKAPVETIPVSTEPVETTSVPVTLPPETTAPPETTVPTETTEPAETIPPPELTVSIYTKMPLISFAGFLYSEEEQSGAVVDTLPEDFVYAGYTVAKELEASYPFPKGGGGQCFNLPWGIEYYASPYQPDYIYYAVSGGYQRLVRAGLKEYTAEDIREFVPEDDYFHIFFWILLSHSVGQNVYNQASDVHFTTPEEIDLGAIFYNGFSGSGVLTQAELDFLADKIPEQFIPDVDYVPRSHMEQTLSRFFGISLSQTQGVGLEELGVYYDKTETYYSTRLDMRCSFLDSLEVVYDEASDTYLLSIKNTLDRCFLMTLKQEGNVLRIVSNIRVEP